MMMNEGWNQEEEEDLMRYAKCAFWLYGKDSKKIYEWRDFSKGKIKVILWKWYSQRLQGGKTLWFVRGKVSMILEYETSHFDCGYHARLAPVTSVQRKDLELQPIPILDQCIGYQIAFLHQTFLKTEPHDNIRWFFVSHSTQQES